MSFQSDSLCFFYRTLPEGTGWILDGFPATLKQAVLLEKVLSGYDAVAMGDELLEPASDATSNKTFSKSSLVPNPRPPQPPPPPVSGLNVVILVDLPDDVCLERAVRTDEFQPVPCTGSYICCPNKVISYKIAEYLLI